MNIENKEIINMSLDELKEVQRPVGKAIYINKEVHIKRWQQKIKCEICGQEYMYSNKSNHDKTKIHKILKKANDNMRKLILNEKE